MEPILIKITNNIVPTRVNRFLRCLNASSMISTVWCSKYLSINYINFRTKLLGRMSN